MNKGRILIIDDQELTQWSLNQKLTLWGYEVDSAFNGEDGLKKVLNNLYDLVLLDLKLPDINGIDILQQIKQIAPEVPVIIITAHVEYEDAISAIRYKAYDFIPKPISFDHLELSMSNAIEANQLKQQIELIRKENQRIYGFSNIVAISQAMKEIVSLAKKIAKSNIASLLLQGESGTGKDIIAKAIHYESNRSNKPFIPINCSALPATLIESELFGYVKGAFTDAKSNKKGVLELANGGTVFLDEISEMELSSQAKLLRVLEEQKFRPLGSLNEISVNVLFIAASNKNLIECIQKNTFRIDLYYRLNVMTINMPPLRKRVEDIPALINEFIKYYNERFKKNIKGISKEAEKILLNYSWPGNVRELKNIIEHAMILEEEPFITEKYLLIKDPTFNPIKTLNDSVFHQLLNDGYKLKNIEKALLEEAINKANGNKTKAANLLGISRDIIRYKLKKYGIKFLR